MYHQKNLVAAILLTVLFGPIGLFYASVIGGMIMTFTPIVFALIYYNGDLAAVITFLIVYGLVGCIIYWPVCIFWSVIATTGYNKRNQKVYEDSQKRSYQHTQIERAIDGDMLEWLRQNPGKSINDFYSK